MYQSATHLLLTLLVGEQHEVIAIDLLGVQHVVVVQLVDVGVLDPVGFQELQVGHGEGLPYRLGYKLGLAAAAGGGM